MPISHQMRDSSHPPSFNFEEPRSVEHATNGIHALAKIALGLTLGKFDGKSPLRMKNIFEFGSLTKNQVISSP